MWFCIGLFFASFYCNESAEWIEFSGHKDQLADRNSFGLCWIMIIRWFRKWKKIAIIPWEFEPERLIGCYSNELRCSADNVNFAFNTRVFMKNDHKLHMKVIYRQRKKIWFQVIATLLYIALIWNMYTNCLVQSQFVCWNYRKDHKKRRSK